MYLLPIPSKVLKQLDIIRRNFLGEGNSNTHKFHLIEWDKVTLPKCKGGLGVRDLASHNKSLLTKWLWSSGTGEPSLWKVVVKAKHNENDHWSTKISSAPYGDKWLNGNTPMDKFPSMYHIAENKNATIAHNRNGNNWDILFRRAAQDWETDQLMELITEVERYNINVTMEDTMCWGRKGIFTVKECYRKIRTQNQVVDDSH
ncbi:unnamed protein product [Withania somnifera]